MPVTHFTKVFAAKDCRISPMLTDVTGGTATFGTSVDVPGIKMIEISGDIETKELRGDNQLLDQDAVLQNVKAKIANAKVSLDAVAVIMGGAVVDSGTTPNQIALWELLGTTTLGLFKLEAVSATADPVAGNVKYTLWKARAASLPALGLAEEDYMIPEMELVTSPLLANSKWMSVAINETAVVLT